MATQRTSWDYLDDMFTTLASQETQRAQAANTAMSSGAAFFQKKEYAKATGEFKRAIAMDPTNSQSYSLLATSYLAQKKNEDAIKTYKASLSLDPTQDDVHLKLGNIYLEQKKYNLAEKEFKEASRLNPMDTVAPYTLGQLYVQTGRYGEAETLFTKVGRMAPNDPNPYYSLGVTYNKMGKSEAAIKQLNQAIKLRPKMEGAHFELGVAYAAMGDTANAQKEVDTLTKLNAAQGELLKRTIAQPKMVAGGGGDLDNFFPILQAPKDPPELNYDPYQLWRLDTVKLKDNPNSSQLFTLTFYFDSKMDAESVQDVTNWTITRASGGAAGYYNNLQPVLPTEAYILQNPMSVTYDPDNQSATVTFMLSQNSTSNATIDSAHMVFKFSGKDVTGKPIDPTADEWDYAAFTPF